MFIQQKRILFGFVLLLTACFAMGHRQESTESTGEVQVQLAVDVSNQFCFELYEKLKENGGNIFFSPFSITMAMAMVFEGARGWTSGEMLDVFKFPGDEKTRLESFSAVYHLVNKKDAKYTLHTANALWIQKDYKILPDYIKKIKEYYYGSVENVDFIHALEQARQTINTWVEKKTNNRIKNLFPPGSLNSNSRLVITNAVYFKGKWVKQFDKELTRDEDFWITEERSVKVPMMRMTDPQSMFNYGETESLQILELPYEGDALSMIILLPRAKDLRLIENGLNEEKFKEYLSLLSPNRVSVFLPRFTFENRYELTKILCELGMPNAFSPHADFSGIDGSRNLFIQTVVHQSYVDVNEEGTEAAAATGVAVGITAVRPKIPVFRADHPFIFVIQEKGTGNILFMGRVVEPELKNGDKDNQR